MGDVAGFLLLLDQLVHVMLGPVLGGGHLEHVGGAEQSLLRVPVGDHLQYDTLSTFISQEPRQFLALSMLPQ